MGDCKEGKEFTVVSANFGGGARAVSVAGGGTGGRPGALAEFIRDPAGDGSSQGLPVVAGIQEQTRLTEPADDYVDKVRRAINPLRPAQCFYLPILTTDWHPLSKKWKSRWAKEGISRMEEGMATYATGEIALADPWVKIINGEILFRGFVLDLPFVEFLTDVKAEDEEKKTKRADYGRWITPDDDLAKQEKWDAGELTYRYTHYQGNRDTQPRCATAHRVWLTDKPGLDDPPQFIFLNVHLATLSAEDPKPAKDPRPKDPQEEAPENEVARTDRIEVVQAQFLRYLQLGVISDFISEVVYEALELPVIVAGDFNADPTSPEMDWFLKKASLEPVFGGKEKKCWKCGESCTPCSPPKPYHTLEQYKEVLTRDDDTKDGSVFKALTGEDPKTIRVKEYCANPECTAEQFTHKRNFGLLDNIFYTAPDSDKGPKWRLEPSRKRKPSCGIRLDTYFSDHLPIWCQFHIR